MNIDNLNSIKIKNIDPIPSNLAGEISRESNNIELIQQWQYLGKVHPRLLDNKVFEYCKKIGLTSVQSYVYWPEIEKEPNKIDFSVYDVLVEKLNKYNLKWVPFLILGPNYATPKWFQKSNESVYAKCLEHNKESRIQSIWNPYLPKWVDRFLGLVAGHYKDCNILESIELGISGNWGEAIYPAGGSFYKDFHTHPGWWCGDKYAIQSFRKYVIKKYHSFDRLNNAWGTNFYNYEVIIFPSLRYFLSFKHDIYKAMPNFIKPGLKMGHNYLKCIKNNIFSLNSISLQNKENYFAKHQQWLDFVEWYLISMTDWAEFWIKTAREYFPNNQIYLATGGNSNPMLGVDFSAQAKVAAKYGAGIRITNHTDNYAESCILSRLVSSASRLYGNYFTTEEAYINQPEGITARIFDAVTSGAKGIYFKSIIWTDSGFCGKNKMPIGEPTLGAKNLVNNYHHFTNRSSPLVKIAIFFPKTYTFLNPTILTLIHNKCSELRDLIDFDLIDENMIHDNVLNKYRFFIILEGNILDKKIIEKINSFVKEGGILIANKSCKRVSSPLMDNGNKLNIVNKIGNGYTILYNCKKRNFGEHIIDIVYNIKNIYPWEGIPEIDMERDGIYAARFADKIMYYNSNNYKVSKKVKITNLFCREFELEIGANSIVSIKI